ncbi:hypothetical protein KL867_17620 [Ruegeria litorea]|uniref:Uncharacterized protein n=1 Tax=Falsiruegeria litorea TaxID=1280831 RepID=A0ABS5WW16_9RHOB|nr:hypothetical protein [Falsiruegeria litorea]MBT3142891.1 hypothetical protein [Falsiruegeria litorea]
MTIRQVHDPVELERMVHSMGKQSLSPILDPGKNDFTAANSFWLVAEAEGVPQMIGGVRVDDLRDLDIRTYWQRSLGRVFGQIPEPLEPKIPFTSVSGKIAYFGDLYSAGRSGLGRTGRDNLRLFTTVGHYLTHLEFSPDVTYCFVRDVDVQRGTPAVYGFLELSPFLYQWGSDPYPSGCPEWIAFTRKDQVHALMASAKRFIEESTRRK